MNFRSLNLSVLVSSLAVFTACGQDDPGASGLTDTDTDTDSASGTGAESMSDDGASAEDDSMGDGDGDGDATETTGDGDGDGDGDGTATGDGDGDGDGDGTTAGDGDGDGDGDGTCMCETNQLAVAVSPYLVGQTRRCAVSFGATAADAIAAAMVDCGVDCNLSHDPTTQTTPAAVGAVAFTATGSYHGYGWSSSCDLPTAEFNAVANCEAISGETCTIACSEQFGTACP